MEILEKFEKQGYKLSLPIIKKNNQMDFLNGHLMTLWKLINLGYQNLFQKKLNSQIFFNASCFI